MIRSYWVRGKKIEVDQIPTVQVMRLPPGEIESRGRGAPVAMWNDTVWERAEEVGIPSSTRQAWERAGWYMVRPASGPAREDLPTPTVVGHLLSNARGEWMIGTPRLTVRLRDELDEDEARRCLDMHRLRVVRRLKFAPHLYEVQAPEDRDSIDIAIQLGQNDDYSYAEPQVIQRLGGR